jgi:hypothetical protein
VVVALNGREVELDAGAVEVDVDVEADVKDSEVGR